LASEKVSRKEQRRDHYDQNREDGGENSHPAPQEVTGCKHREIIKVKDNGFLFNKVGRYKCSNEYNENQYLLKMLSNESLESLHDLTLFSDKK
jgi:hypothetical protein